MKKCGKECLICPYIKVGKSISNQYFTWSIKKNVNCGTPNIVYMIECNKDNCKQQYIGQTDKYLRTRILQHIGYIRNKLLNKATGYHFNTPGHSIQNFTVTILEQVRKRDLNYRREREKYHINRFNTFYKGLNRMP